jgi:hypothetical protein
MLLALTLGIALVALLPSVAAAKKHSACGDQVVADWYDDGRVGKIYPLHCYRDAIASLPSDVIDYSNAKEEISRALSFAKQGKPDPGGSGHGTTTPVETTAGTTPGGGGKGKPSTDTGPIDTIPVDTNYDTAAVDTVDTAATKQTDTSGPSSVPVPLIVLGGLAVVLLAAGSAGYLRRRSNSGGDDDATPPASA